jgi:hypothetical protein
MVDAGKRLFRFYPNHAALLRIVGPVRIFLPARPSRRLRAAAAARQVMPAAPLHVPCQVGTDDAVRSRESGPLAIHASISVAKQERARGGAGRGRIG